jgi:dipeptidyl aminopeptidase/acylaminoacyl peptidase
MPLRAGVLLPALVGLALLLALSIGQTPQQQHRHRKGTTPMNERQITSSPLSHALDNNDNFSPDDRFLSVDTRDSAGSANATSIWKVNIATGEETKLYAPQPVLVNNGVVAPRMYAASFNFVGDEVIFIHGPLAGEVPTLGPYGFTNRRGAIVAADGSGRVQYTEMRDLTAEPTTPGALRGGTHRHEFSPDGKRIGFTYDDALVSKLGYGRTIGMMVKHPKSPAGVSHYAVLLVPIVPAGTAKNGDIERADGDSWVGAKGLMRAFIGKVKEADGSYMSSLFVIDIPENVDVTTADPGTKTRMPAPPAGVKVRRLTHIPAMGIARGSLDGSRIAYYAAAPNGAKQVFLIPSHGGDKDAVQATFFEKGVGAGVRWHPSGNSIAVLADNGVAAVCVKPGPQFGKSVFLTPHGAEATGTGIEALVWSHDGKRLAFNRRVPTRDSAGNTALDNTSANYRQIFVTDFPDANGNGIPDPVE